MNIAKKWVLTAVLAGSITGGALGGLALSTASVNAATGATGSSGSSSTAPSTAPSGKFVPNENAAHEKSERAAREAQEDAGQFPTVP